MQGARRPHPIPRGTAPAVTSWALRDVRGGPRGARRDWRHPAVLPCPAQPLSNPQSCSWSRRLLLTHPKQGAPSCDPPVLAAPPEPTRRCQQRTNHFVVDRGRCWVVVREHPRGDGPPVAQVVVLGREETPINPRDR